MPIAQYFAADGTLVAQATATSVSSDGTSMVIPGFGTSTLAAGSYLGFVSNAVPNGIWKIVGSGSVQVLTPSATIIGTEQHNGQTDDAGQVSVTVNGFGKTAGYGVSDTASTITSMLTTAFNSDSAAPVTGTSANGALWVSAKSDTTTIATISVSSESWAYPPYPGVASFVAIPSSGQYPRVAITPAFVCRGGRPVTGERVF
jgi:phage tail sheath gpL-like